MRVLHIFTASWLACADGLSSTVPRADCLSLYRPFIECADALFAESGLKLRDYPLDDSLRHCETATGSASRRSLVALSLQAYCTDELRLARLALIEGGSGLQVLNFCIFPSLEYGLPTFAADLVTLPGGHLVALDWAPNGEVSVDAAFAHDGALASCFTRHRKWLPDGGPLPETAKRYFSPYFLWSRLPAGDASDATMQSTVRAAFEGYLRAYLQLVVQATPLEGAAALGDVRAAQRSYSRYRAESDPARPMLTRLFGEEFAERLIGEVLFPSLPVTRAEGGRG
jgi:phycoerythrobilin:ferredoxin oxidoreductase